MESINVFIDKLIKKNNHEYLNKIFENYELGLFQVHESYHNDNVIEDKIYKLIKKSKRNILIRYFIPDILFLINDESITDLIIDFCLNYKGRFRETLLITLAHKWLNIEQLEKLNKNITTPEAFYRLFIIYMQTEEFKLNQLEYFMMINKKHWNSLLNYKEHIQEKNVSIVKINYIDRLISECKYKI